MKRNGSFCIIICDGEILLFHRDNNPTIAFPDHWQLPGGGLEENETWLEALQRELREEVSHCPDDLHFIGFYKKEDGSQTAYFMTYVHDKSVFKHGPGEGQEIRFFTIEEAKKLPLTRGINTYLNTYEQVFHEHIANKTIIKPHEIGLTK